MVPADSSHRQGTAPLSSTMVNTDTVSHCRLEGVPYIRNTDNEPDSPPTLHETPSMKTASIWSAYVFALFAPVLSTAQASNLPEALLRTPIPLISAPPTSLSAYQGRQPVYLKFWATWCQPCRQQLPHFEHVQQEYGDRIAVIGINLGLEDDLEAVQATTREFGLTMPMAIDTSGDLAQNFRLVGTPYHLLFDRNMNLIHRGHDADPSLDNKLALVARAETIPALDANLLNEHESDVAIATDDGRLHALFFTATWCDWYLADTRPTVSKACMAAQRTVNQLYIQKPDIAWQGLVSRLWTADQDLREYRKKYGVEHPIDIDRSNRLFHHYGVSELPQLILVKNGRVVARVSEFDSAEAVAAILRQ
ncbi:MAG: TlpA family protein disulfide reductase [Parahaliea sp.]